jgi:hypothetical protein
MVVSAFEKPEQQRNDERNQQAGAERKVNGKILFFDDDIAWQPAGERQFVPQQPEQADPATKQTDQDQEFTRVHDQLLVVGA